MCFICFSSNGGGDFALARYTNTGALDTTFDTDGKVTTAIGSEAEASALAVQSDGKIVAVGIADMTGTDFDFALVRYTTFGALDKSFSADGKATQGIHPLSSDWARSVVIQSDGMIVIGGEVDSNNIGGIITSGLTDFVIARFTPGGALDTTFGRNGFVLPTLSPSNDSAFALALQPDGKILAAGFSRIRGKDDFAVIRVFK